MRNHLETLEFGKLKQILSKQIQTDYGRETLSALTPVFDLEKAKREFETLGKFFDFFYKFGTYTLDNINISGVIREAFSGPLNEKELLNIGNFLGMLNDIEKHFKEHSAEELLYIINFEPISDLYERINDTIDEHGFLKDSATPYLEELRNRIRNLKEEIVRQLKNSMHSRLKEVIKDTAVFLKRSRYTLLLKPNFKEYIKGRIIDVSKSGGLFVEPDSIYEKNNALEELLLKEEAERRRILSKITSMVRRYSSKLRHNERRLGFFDLQMAKFAYMQGYELPEISFTNRQVVYAKQAKHPILAHIKPQETKSVDIDLKNQKHLLITGPNTGGKTVFLKTVGLMVISIFSGIPPIASTIEIGPIDNVFAVIGDEQDIMESLSSFSAKIMAFKEIYNQISKNSLVLLDEIGNGTSPDEGEAVAYAIIKHLTDKCMFVATTHYKRLAYILSSENYPTAAFEFDEKTLKPTYRLIYNKIGYSYAMEVIKNLNLPEEIVKTAQEFYKHNETNFSKLEKELEEKSRQLESKIAEYENLKKALEETKTDTERKTQEKLKELEKRKVEAEKAYTELTEKLKKEINRLLKQKNTSEAHRNLNMIKKEASSLFKTKEKAKEGNSFKSGEIVKFMGMTGKVVETKTPNRVIIEIDGKAIEVHPSRLERAQQEQKPQVTLKISKPQERLEINLIGKRRDEAELELLRFLDSTIAGSAKSVRIIHGIGSGILRQMVHETLKNHPYIKSFHPAHPSEGGDGATIAELK